MELHLFYNGPASLELAVAGGIDAVVVDCEEAGKEQRQHGCDTEINRWRPRDCEIVRRLAPSLRVLCRIDSIRNVGELAIEQALTAVRAGADEVLLPMVDRLDEIRWMLDALGERAGLGVMIETEGGVALAGELDGLPLKRVFMGLNDLMIERRSRHLFEHVLDGTVERVRSRIRRLDFGFGGMTLPDRGTPVPCHLLLGELARLRCQFTFLRRSFFRDFAASGLEPSVAVGRMRAAWQQACDRTSEAVESDRQALELVLRSVVQGVGN